MAGYLIKKIPSSLASYFEFFDPSTIQNGGGTIPAVTVTNLRPLSTTTTSVNVAFDCTTDAIVKIKNNLSLAETAGQTISAKTFNFVNLLQNTSYTIYVTPVGQTNSAAMVVLTQAEDVVSAVTNLSVGTITETSAIVSWGGSTNVEVSVRNNSTNAIQSVVVSGNNRTLSNLIKGTSYTIVVKAVGTQVSSTVDFTTANATAPTPSGTVSGLTVSAINDHGAMVTWAGSNNVELWIEIPSLSVIGGKIPVSGTTYTFAQLGASLDVIVKVQGVGSTIVAAAPFKTLAAGETAEVATTGVENLRVTATTATTVAIAWDGNSVATISNVPALNPNALEIIGTSTTNSYTVTNLVTNSIIGLAVTADGVTKKLTEIKVAAAFSGTTEGGSAGTNKDPRVLSSAGYFRVVGGAAITPQRPNPFTDFATPGGDFYVTQATQAALVEKINAASAAGGGKVYAYNGSVDITSTIEMKPNVKLYGQANSKLNAVGNMDGLIKLKNNCTNVVIGFLEIDGNKDTGSDTAGLAILTARNVYVHNNHVHHTRRCGINFYGESVGAIKNVLMYNNKVTFGGKGYGQGNAWFLANYNENSPDAYHAAEFRYVENGLMASNTFEDYDSSTDLSTGCVNCEAIGNVARRCAWGIKSVGGQGSIIAYNNYEELYGSDDAATYTYSDGGTIQLIKIIDNDFSLVGNYVTGVLWTRDVNTLHWYGNTGINGKNVDTNGVQNLITTRP